tara:strand:+ start:9461 stop:9886 length:426 start_codon:yes stop_codon:yes gene_type:complete
MDYKGNINFELEKTAHLIRSKTLEVFRENNFLISKEQWLVLERIAAKEGSNQKDIAKDTFKDPAALTRMLDLLVDKGFAQRKASKSDRRTFDIYLTVEGGRLVNRMNPIIEEQNTTIETALTSKDKNSLVAILQKLQQPLL